MLNVFKITVVLCFRGVKEKVERVQNVAFSVTCIDTVEFFD